MAFRFRPVCKVTGLLFLFFKGTGFYIFYQSADFGNLAIPSGRYMKLSKNCSMSRIISRRQCFN
jgi:hypothetical protein